MHYRAWIKSEKKMYPVKLIGGGYCWIDWIDSCKPVVLADTAHEIGVTCEVMRGTGMHDENTTEIYEDDIIQWPNANGVKYQVCYDRWGIPALISDSDTLDFKEAEMLHRHTPAQCTIVGNKYEGEL